MSSPPVASPSPPQPKGKDCDSKAGEEVVAPSKGTSIFCGNGGGAKPGNTYFTRSMGSGQCKEVCAEQDQLTDELSCLYCRREFETKRGLSLHLAHCKNRQVFELDPNQLPTCSVVLDRLPDVQVVSEGEDEIILGPVDFSCFPDGCDAGFALTCPVNHHSAESRPTNDAELKIISNFPDRLSIKWPRMNDVDQWAKLDEVVAGQLKDWWTKTDSKIRCLETVLYDEAKAMFGVVSSSMKTKFVPRRQKDIMSWRSKLNDLKKAWKKASSDDERAGIDLLEDECRSQIRNLKRAECSRKRRWRRRTLRAKFYKDPYEVARNVLKPKVVCQPSVSKETLNNFVHDASSDPNHNVPLGDLDDLPDFSINLKPFDTSPFCFNNFLHLLKRKRNGSKPGPNKIPYKVYKKCTKLSSLVFNIMEGVRRGGVIPLRWRIAEGFFLPKVDKPDVKNLGDFRTISLMNVEAKLFWSMVSSRLYKHLVISNNIIDTSMQKGSIQKMAGVWEHTAMVWEGLKDARKRRKSMVVLWLDLANAYGSVPHKLIEFALRRYGVPSVWIDLILSYYNGLWSRTRGGELFSDWFLYEIGIFAGCTISVILFLAAFNIFLEFVSRLDVPRYQLENGNYLPLLRGFMDDLSAMTTNVMAGNLVLSELDKVLAWARMKPKAPKSRSCVIKSGRSMNVAPFTVRGEVIPSIQSNPVKTLGRIIDGSLTDRKSRGELFKKVVDGLVLIDRSVLTGVMKLFTYQFVFLYRICWPLMIYEIPLSWVEDLEPKINKFLRKWLGLHKSLSSVALYCKDTPCPLPLSSIITEFKKRKAGAYLQLKESRDSTVSENVPNLYTGRKWRVEKAVADAEADISISHIVGYTQRGTKGFGSFGRVKEVTHRKEVTNAIGQSDNKLLFTKAAQQTLQGKWTRWENIIQRDMSFSRLLRSSPQMLSFTLGVTFETIASPTNLKRWGLSDDESCCLCDAKRCTLSHVLSACKTSLTGGRYRFRHDLVLKAICHSIQSFINLSRKYPKPIPPEGVPFVKEGSTVAPRKRCDPLGLLGDCNDWHLLADIDKQLKFPSHIFVTLLRPDIVIYSNARRILIMIELTCPCEQNIGSAHVSKTSKYSYLIAMCQKAGWVVHFFAVEVGARGYASVSLKICFSKLGLSGRKLKEAINDASLAASKGSFWIWLKRTEVEWDSKRTYKRKINASACATKSAPQISNIPKSVVRLPRGIVNLGNTCYVSASIQSIFSVHCCLHPAESVLFTILKRTLCDLSSSTKTALYPIALISEVRKMSRAFSQNSFQDAHEFLISILSNSQSRTFSLTVIANITCSNCSFSTQKDEQLFGLQLVVERNLSASLASYFQDTDVLWNCSECSQSTTCKKSFAVIELPNVLLLQLKRFRSTGNRVDKITSRFEFPLTNLVFQGQLYNLAAVIYHHGSVSSGHYTASICSNNQWFLCDDEKVSMLDSRSVVTPDAYILTYKLV